MKHEKLLELFFNEPTKHWRFKELKEESDLSKQQLNKWLKKFQKDNLIKKYKKEGHPFYQANQNSWEYKNKKKLFALTQLSELFKILQNSKAKTIILFGSFSTSDWHTDSDIDLFIYGKEPKNLPIYIKKLHKRLEIHQFKDKREIKEINSGLIKNVLNGYLIKGDLNEIIEASKAKL